MRDIVITNSRSNDDGSNIDCAVERPSLSTVSPSGLHLAVALEHNERTDCNEALGQSARQLQQRASSLSPRRDRRHHDSSPTDGSHARSKSSVPSPESMSHYGVAIATSYPATHSATTAAGRATRVASASSKTAPASSSAASSPNEQRHDDAIVIKCPMTARVTALQWLDDSHLACGLQDGTVTLLARDAGSNISTSPNPPSSGGWTPTLSRCFHRVVSGGGTSDDHGRRRVMRIRLSGQGSVGGVDGAGAAATARGGGSVGGGAREALTLWILYEDRVVVCVSAEALVALARQRADSVNTTTTDENSVTTDQQPNSPDGSSPPPLASGPSFAKLQLEGQGEILDVVACPAPVGLFDVRQDRHSHVILAAGVSPALAFYLVGSESRSIGLVSIAWAVATRVTSLTAGAIDGIFGLVGLGGRGRRRRRAAAAAAEAATKGRSDEFEARDESPPPLVLRWDGGLQDGRRRVTRLCLDPSGRLAAAADGFGRVMLVDCSTRQILRMWKGVRDAECGWLEVVESWIGPRIASVGTDKQAAFEIPTTENAANSNAEDDGVTPVIGLYLAILAPLRGRVELWRMRHGPCVRVIPAPANARLLTSKPASGGNGFDTNDVNGRGINSGSELGRHGRVTCLTSCYILSGGEGGTAVDETATKLRLDPVVVEAADLASLPNRLSRAATVDDDYRLRQFGAALSGMKHSRGGTTTRQLRRSTVGERGRLSAGRELQEEVLFELLAELESVGAFAQAVLALGGRTTNEHGRPVGNVARSSPTERKSNGGIIQQPRASQASVKLGKDDGSRSSLVLTRKDTVLLSASFQRRVCGLCRERTQQAEGAPAAAAAAVGSDEDEESAKETLRQETASAMAVLRFRANVYELYTILESVEVQPAGATGEEVDGDRAFLPPGKRGWKHAFLCEEAAGWAEMTREGRGSFQGAGLASAELPDFQDFLDTVSLVLELPQAPSPMQENQALTPLLQFINIEGDSKKSEDTANSRSRRVSGENKCSPESVLTSGSQSAADSFAADSTLSGDPAAAASRLESAECRERLVGWLFRPLLSDAFAMASLSQALNLLGMSGKHEAITLVRDMSHWFLALPVSRAADITVGREAQNCPVLRWLKAIIILAVSSPTDEPTSKADGPGLKGWDGRNNRDIFGVADGEKSLAKSMSVEAALGKKVHQAPSGGGLFGDDVGGADADSGNSAKTDIRVAKITANFAVNGDISSGEEAEADDDQEQEASNDDDSNGDFQAEAEAMLQPMFEACATSQRLENAAMLAVVTAEALFACRERLEESSLGRVAIGGGEAWLVLARRLRLCLFVDHRLRWGSYGDDRNRATVRHFEEGKASVYALAAKDQLISSDDLSFAACAARENAEVEASTRSQRETAEAKASEAKVGPKGEGTRKGVGLAVVAAAPTLADFRMDEHWREVQAVATRQGAAGTKPKSPSSASSSDSFSLKLAIVGLSTTPATSSLAKHKKDRNEYAAVDKTRQSPRDSNAAALPATDYTAATTTLFYMRSHAQPIVLACHRARWLVRAWFAIGPAAEREAANAALSGTQGVVKTRAAEGAVRLLSLSVDHLSYLRTANPFLAGCVAYWLWEHEGVRTHIRDLARGIAVQNDGSGARSSSGPHNQATKSGGVLPEAGRPAREAFLAAAEEFLHVEALFMGEHQEDAMRAGRRGSGSRRGGGDVSFMSLLTPKAVQLCPWPGAWDVWVEECLRGAQVHPPLPLAVTAHTTLLRALRVSTVCGLPEGEAQGLFARGNDLCTEASLRNDHLATPASSRDINVEGHGVKMRREAYVRRALEAIVPRPAQNVYRLARDFGLQEDAVRGWHCLVLLRRGHDVLGEEAMAQVYSLQGLAGDILTIMRLRLKCILDYLETSPTSSGGLLASLDADTCQWVRSARDLEATCTGGSGVEADKGAGEPLRSTHGVLLCLARALPPDSRYKLQANALVTLVGTILRQIRGAM